MIPDSAHASTPPLDREPALLTRCFELRTREPHGLARNSVEIEIRHQQSSCGDSRPRLSCRAKPGLPGIKAGAWTGKTWRSFAPPDSGGGCPHIVQKNNGQRWFQRWPSKHSLSSLTAPCPGDLGHVGHSRGAGPAVAAHFLAAAGPVSEPIHAAVAADEARFGDATRSAGGRSADAVSSPAASSTDGTRSAEE